MSIVSRYEEPVEIACDECGYVWDDPAEADPYDFGEVWTEMKKYNWTVRKIGEDWWHYCGDCNGKNNVNPRGVRR